MASAPGAARATGSDARPIVVRTLAGSGTAGTADGPAAQARFELPSGVAVTGDGTVYVADAQANTIRAIGRAGTVTTVAGAANEGGFADGPGATARFRQPLGLAAGRDGSLYICDAGNAAIRRLDHGAVTTVAGGPQLRGASDGPVVTATFRFPRAVTVAADGTLYVADNGAGVRRIGADGAVTTLRNVPSKIVFGVSRGPGRTLWVTSQAGVQLVDAPSESLARSLPPTQTMMAEAVLGNGYGIAAFDDEGFVMTDIRTNTVRYVEGLESVRVVAGAPDWDPVPWSGGFADGPGGTARFYAPVAVAIAPDKSVVVADAGNHRVRAISAWDHTTYVPATGAHLERFTPGPNEDGIVWIGQSQAWNDTTWYESIPGVLQRTLEASPQYANGRRRPKVIPIAFPGSQMPAFSSFIKTTLAGGFAKVVIFQITTPYGVTSEQMTAALRDMKSVLDAGHVKLIALVQPEGAALSPVESMALYAFAGANTAAETRRATAYPALVAAVRASGVPTYDALPDMEAAERNGEGPLYGTSDPHANARGRAIIGRAAAKALAEYYFPKR